MTVPAFIMPATGTAYAAETKKEETQLSTRMLRRLVQTFATVASGAQAKFLFAALTILLIASAPAWPQAYVQEFQGYTLRSSTTGTENLAAETARAHGILRDPHRAALNVTVFIKNAETSQTVPARVHSPGTGSLSGKAPDSRHNPQSGPINGIGR